MTHLTERENFFPIRGGHRRKAVYGLSMVKACHLHNSGNELSFQVATLQTITPRLPVHRFNSLIMGSLPMAGVVEIWH